ncbi:MAG: hypothetical protein A3E01_06095 [Gammaproteobacteria bacterium RIFCSPHIGHO2_12_FULL_63_22]|nr:MAG: hypothetical protein A3E01_06095 [Gammaproteobacteria bacterium RIFCSPHIGHO2_12_FULL_63_22]
MVDTTLVRDIVEHCRTRPELLRRQGPTFLQLEPSPDVWLHFWGNAAASVPVKISAQSHTHHRGFTSTIVLGGLTNTLLQMKEVDDGALFDEYLLTGGDHRSASVCEPTGRKLVATHASATRYGMGDMYDMVPDTWHRTLFTQPSITLLHLRGPVVPRYIAFPVDTPAARLDWVDVDPVEAWARIDGLLHAAGVL